MSLSQVTRPLLKQTQAQHAPLPSTVCSHDPHYDHRLEPKHMQIDVRRHTIQLVAFIHMQYDPSIINRINMIHLVR